MDDEKKNTSPEGSETPTPATQGDKAPEGQPKQINWVARLLGGDILQSKWVLKQMPLVVLCLIYCLVLVFCRYTVEGLTMESRLQQERLDSLQQERNNMQKNYQETVKISQIAARLDSSGVGITAGPPYEI